MYIYYYILYIFLYILYIIYYVLYIYIIIYIYIICKCKCKYNIHTIIYLHLPCGTFFGRRFKRHNLWSFLYRRVFFCKKSRCIQCLSMWSGNVAVWSGDVSIWSANVAVAKPHTWNYLANLKNAVPHRNGRSFGKHVFQAKRIN